MNLAQEQRCRLLVSKNRCETSLFYIALLSLRRDTQPSPPRVAEGVGRRKKETRSENKKKSPFPFGLRICRQRDSRTDIISRSCHSERGTGESTYPDSPEPTSARNGRPVQFGRLLACYTHANKQKKKPVRFRQFVVRMALTAGAR